MRLGSFFHLMVLVVFVLAAATRGVVSGAPAGQAINGYSARPWVEAEPLFHRDPRWLGADAALSIPLGNNRTLWLFGDTFIAVTRARVRAESVMIRNTVAIQTGNDPRTASIKFSWRTNTDRSPAPFFPNNGKRWYWPGHGLRLTEGPLVIFLYVTVPTPGKGLGFASTGYAIAVIDNPDSPADKWRPRIVEALSSSFDAIPATAVLRQGANVVALAIRQEGAHAGALVRYSAASLAKGDLTGAEWWTSDGGGWVPEANLDRKGPTFVMDDAGAECSLHWDNRANAFIHVASYGFGTSTIGVRTASSITGPWSPMEIVYRPKESDGPHPFVYAAKAHPELSGPNAEDLVVTYATNSFNFADLVTKHGQRSLYWPRFVLVRSKK